MALQRTCVRCGSAPAHRVEASLALWNVAEEDQPTGIILADDACASCQEAVIGILQKHTVEMLREQAPKHAEIIKLAKERDDAQRAVNEHELLVKADADKATAQADSFNAARGSKSAASPDQYRDQKIVDRHARLLAAVADKESKRIGLHQAATELSDKRQALMLDELKGKGSRGK